MMSDVILERTFDTSLTDSHLRTMAERSVGCFGLYRVGWHQSLLSKDGLKLTCWFDVPDHESLRMALRSGGDISDIWPGKETHLAIWSGTIHDAPGASENEIGTANVIVERQFEQQVTLEEIQDREDAGSGCLEVRNVRFLRTFFSADRKRMLCLYKAPDAESVRQAQQQAGMPIEAVWPFTRYSPASFAQNTTVDKTLA